jgi:hypothetical protein
MTARESISRWPGYRQLFAGGGCLEKLSGTIFAILVPRRPPQGRFSHEGVVNVLAGKMFAPLRRTQKAGESTVSKTAFQFINNPASCDGEIATHRKMLECRDSVEAAERRNSAGEPNIK